MAIIATTLVVEFKVGSILASVLEGAPPLQQSALVLGLMVFFAVYLTGQMVALLSDFLERRVATRLFPSHRRVLRDAATGGNGYSTEIRRFMRDKLTYDHGSDSSTLTDVDYERAVAVWHYWLLVHDVGAGERTAKVRAEHRMYGGLAVAAFAYLAEHPAASIARPVRLNAPLLLLAAVIGALGLSGAWPARTAVSSGRSSTVITCR